MSASTPSAEASALPAFVLLAASATEADACASLGGPRLEGALSRVLGFAPAARVAVLTPESPEQLRAAIDDAVASGHDELYLLPTMLSLDIARKQCLIEAVRGAQRRHPEAALYYDEPDPCHPLLLHAFIDAGARALAQLPAPRPGRVGLMLAASGDGDPEARADSYRLMRLLWEQLSCGRGEVGFVRHERVTLSEQLRACDATPFDWIVVSQFLWPTEHFEFAQVIASDFARGTQRVLPMAQPIGEHPNVRAWIEQRALQLWRARRRKDATRVRSQRHAPARQSALVGPKHRWALDDLPQPLGPDHSYGTGLIADLADPAQLSRLLDAYGLRTRDQRVFVKVTWHGYATGTYTDPVALDALLAGLPRGAVVVEGHSSSRNLGGGDWDWELEEGEHRAWIRQQEQEYLERTGLAQVLDRHGAQYVNVTEHYWDGQCAAPEEVKALLAERGVQLQHEELLGYVPRLFLENASSPFISFARFKGPTRLSISNMFGLLPMPLRSAWHGPNITYFARVCCELTKLYACLFELHALCESLNVAVRWDRRGLYRSRWGNYDLVERPGLVTLAPDLATADVLASRLQGQDVSRSAFFDVVRHELGFPPELAQLPIDTALLRRFA